MRSQSRAVTAMDGRDAHRPSRDEKADRWISVSCNGGASSSRSATSARTLQK